MSWEDIRTLQPGHVGVGRPEFTADRCGESDMTGGGGSCFTCCDVFYVSFFLCSGGEGAGSWWNGTRKHLPEKAITAPATWLHCIGFGFLCFPFEWIYNWMLSSYCFHFL